MMQRLLQHPLPVVLALVLLALAGVAALPRLPVDLFPRLDYPLINVVTHYPAGTAEDMEQLITTPIENALLGMIDLRRVRSTSAPGFSQVTVEFTWGIDALQARQQVAARLAGLRLPAGVRPALENVGTSLAMVSTYTLYGGDPVALRGWARYELAPRLAALPGVARVQVMGGGRAAWRIDVDPRALLQHGVTLDDIARAVRRSNVLDTGGFIERPGRDLLVRTDGRLHRPEDLRQVRVGQGPDGRPVRLGEVAAVHAGILPQRYLTTRNRLPAVAFTIQKQPGASTLAVSHAVDTALAAMKLPPQARLQKFYDQAEIIGLAYRNMRNELLSGALLAVLALFLVLGRNRASLVIALSLPLTALATFWLMGQLDMGLNLMTLGALTVAIGMVADDAIVVLENIDRHRREGNAPMAAARSGTREILGADVTGTLAVLAAFAPLVLLGGLAGRLLHPFGITFSLLLGFSLILSLTLIPLASAHWMGSGPARPHGGPGAWLTDRFRRFNLHLLDRLLRHPGRSLVLALVLLATSLALLAFNPARMLPLLDEDSLLLSYGLAPGTSLTEGNRAGDALEQRVLAVPGVAAVYRRTGSPEDSFYIEGPAEGELMVRLDRRGSADPLSVKARLERLLAATPGIVGRVNEPTTEKLDESFSGLPALFGITLVGRNLDRLYAAARQVERTARRTPGLATVVNNTKVPVDQVDVRLDRSALARFGIDARTAATTLRRAMQGDTLTEVLIDQRPVPVFLRFAPAWRRRLADLRRLRIPAADGRQVPLSRLADIGIHSGFPLIQHQRGIRSLTLTAEIEGNPLTVLRRLTAALQRLPLPAGIQWRYSGEYGVLLHTGRQLAWILLAAAVLVYGLIAIQLGNLLDPAVVLAKLPLDFAGAALALFLTRQPLDLTVAIGFITLVGVATNNGIMLLTFTRHFRARGLDAVAAVQRAVALRSRPMLLTHLTTLLALVPAALGLGHGPQLLQPLGIMLFGGLTAGTLFTLNLLPVLYVVTERWRKPPGPGRQRDDGFPRARE